MWPWCLSSTLSMSDNAQMQCLGRILCCNAPQRCTLFLACPARVSLYLWAQKVLHCSRADHRHERTRRSWGSHWIFGGAVTAVLLVVWLGTRCGQGNSLLYLSSLQRSGPSTSESPSLTSRAGDHLEGQAGRSCLYFLFPVCTPWIFNCLLPGE